MPTENAGLAEGQAQSNTDDQIDLDDAGTKPGDADTKKVNTEETKSPEPKAEGKDDDDEDAERSPKRPSGSARLKEQNRHLRAERDAALAERDDARQFIPRPEKDGTFNLDALIEQEIGPMPQEKDFPEFLDFRDERAAYLSDKRRVGRELRAWVQNALAAQEHEAKQIIDGFKERAEEVAARIPDFEQVLSGAQEAPNDPAIRRMLLTSEKGPELAYYLSKNPNIVRSLNAMRPLEAAMELGCLKNRLSSIPPKTMTNASEPIPALKGGSSTKKSPDEMSVEEYDAYYQKKLKAKGG